MTRTRRSRCAENGTCPMGGVNPVGSMLFFDTPACVRVTDNRARRPNFVACLDDDALDHLCREIGSRLPREVDLRLGGSMQTLVLVLGRAWRVDGNETPGGAGSGVCCAGGPPVVRVGRSLGFLGCGGGRVEQIARKSRILGSDTGLRGRHRGGERYSRERSPRRSL